MFNLGGVKDILLSALLYARLLVYVDYVAQPNPSWLSLH